MSTTVNYDVSAIKYVFELDGIEVFTIIRDHGDGDTRGLETLAKYKAAQELYKLLETVSRTPGTYDVKAREFTPQEVTA